jgi:hypothetical protein
MALACLGLANKARAGTCLPTGSLCKSDNQCCSGVCPPVLHTRPIGHRRYCY